MIQVNFKDYGLKFKYSCRMHYIILTLNLNTWTTTGILVCYIGKVDQELLRKTDFESNYYYVVLIVTKG